MSLITERCNTSSAYRHFDKVYLQSDFGAILIPLDQVKSIIPKIDREIDQMIGVDYGDWTEGSYPYNISWQKESIEYSRGLSNIDITDAMPFDGTGSLEFDVWLRPDSSYYGVAGGFVDLRYHLSGYDADHPVEIIKNENGDPAGIDLAGKTISFMVYPPKGTGGSVSTPNGIQLYLKSVHKDENGQEVWSNYYFDWQNIWKVRDPGADPKLGKVKEGIWNRVSFKVPTKIDGQLSDIPEFGVADAEFNPNLCALMGIKTGLNENANDKVDAKIYVDNLGWDDVVLKFEDVDEPIQKLKNSGFNAVAILQTEYMDTSTSSEIKPVPKKTHSEYELKQLIKKLYEDGFNIVALKPHVDVLEPANFWRGEIQPTDVDAWFLSYKQMLLKYAKIGEPYGVELLIISTELETMTKPEYLDYWTDIIASVRAVYSGKITMAVNWDGFNKIDKGLYDLLDLVGIDFYASLAETRNPSYASLMTGWEPWVEKLEAFYKKTGKKIIFTEIGYRSIDFASGPEPWDYQTSRPINLELQKRCYQAAVDTFRDKSWWQGCLFWQVSPQKDGGGKFDTNFTCFNKPAMTFLQE